MPQVRILPLIAMLALARSAWAADAPTNDAIFTELTAADQARATAATETQAWTAERERMQVLAAALADEIERQRKELARSETQLADLAKDRSDAAADRRALNEALACLEQRAAEIKAQLSGLAGKVVPGTVQVPAAGGDQLGAFDEAMRALDASERAAGGISVDLIEGRLDGSPRAVKMLRVAGVGWWSDLTGEEAGTVLAGGDAPTLIRSTDAAERERIRVAIAIAEGHRRAELVELPLNAQAGP